MAIEDDDIKDRVVWTGVTQHWYSIASNISYTTGRLHHHLAILARPNPLHQLSLYAKSLCVAIPFTTARESILTLFDQPLLKPERGYGLPSLDYAFMKSCVGVSRKNLLNITLENNERPARRALEVLSIYNRVADFEHKNESHDFLQGEMQIYEGKSLYAESQDAHLPLLQSLNRRAPRLLTELLSKIFGKGNRKLIASMLIAVNLPNTTALPLDLSLSLVPDPKPAGFIQFWETIWDQFKDQYSGPLVMNTALGTTLTILYRTIKALDEGALHDSDLLLLALYMSSWGSFFLAMGDSISGWQLALLFLFEARLTLALLRQKLSTYPGTGDMTKFSLVMSGILSSGIMAQHVELADVDI